MGESKTSDQIQIKIKVQKPKSGTFSPNQSPKSGLKGHGCSFLIQNQDRERKFETGLYKKSVEISKS